MTVTLTRDALAEATMVNQHVWPLKVVAARVDPTFPSEIFVYHSAVDSSEGDVFEAVASVQQLSELGLAPVVVDTLTTVPYYRSATLLFYCRSQHEADELWEKVLDDVNDLIENFNAARNLKASEVVTL